MHFDIAYGELAGPYDAVPDLGFDPDPPHAATSAAHATRLSTTRIRMREF